MSRATTSPSWRSSAPCCAWRRRGCSRPTGRCASASRATAVACRRRSPRRCRWCSPSCCRTRWTTASRRRPAAATSWCAWRTTSTSCTSWWSTTGAVWTPGFELNKATGLGLSIVRTLVTTELDGTISMRAGTPEDFELVGLGVAAQGRRHGRRPHRPGVAAAPCALVRTSLSSEHMFVDRGLDAVALAIAASPVDDRRRARRQRARRPRRRDLWRPQPPVRRAGRPGGRGLARQPVAGRRHPLAGPLGAVAHRPERGARGRAGPRRPPGWTGCRRAPRPCARA